MFDAASAAVEGALAAGARYADARVVSGQAQSIDCLNQNLESLDTSERFGLGVRALIGSSWGFFATQDLADAGARKAGARAAEIARASGLVPGADLELADVPVVEDEYETPHEEPPLAVSLSEKVDLLVATTREMQAVAGVGLAHARLDFWDTETYFVSSQGHRIRQRIVQSGGEAAATAIGESETQRRSYPQSFGHYLAGGYEVVRGFDLPAHAARLGEEAVQLLTAPECPETTTDLILESSQLALQIHESVGHATELDRILGWEAAFAGTSWLELDKLGSLKYGSELMNITADATLPGALATFGYDDEGTPSQSVDIVRDGTWVGVLSGRDSAALTGLPPGGMVRGDGYDRLPMVRMTNVGLLAGDSSLEEIVSETKDGVLMATNRSWSIDDKRLNFQFGCEAGWEVKNGKLGRLLRNPTYTGVTPEFWAGLDMLGGEDELVFWGVPNCGKGQPMQTARTSHPAPAGRFRGVRIGVKG
jgi:TldD protein